MAALLRSTRFLKLSSSPLLRVNTHSNGAPVSRNYSRAARRKGVRVYSGLVSSKTLCVNSSAGPSLALRYYSAAVERKGVLKDEPSIAVRTKQAQQFDWALDKLDSSVRRTGRVTKTLMQRIFHEICRTGYPSSNQALLLLRSCGSLLPEMPLDERNQLAHRIWEKLQELGTTYDVSHYNALLKVYLQNEYKFSPTDFLEKMEAANVQPNRVTYQRLIAAYCQNGDIEGASKILGFMKSKDLPITEAVFNSLVTGHSRAGDMESSENILSVMRGAGIEPGPDTYLALLVAYAEQGNIAKIQETLNTAESEDASLMDRDLMQIVFSLAKSGHQQYVPDIMERMRHERGYVPDAINLCLSLTTQGFEDIAFIMLKNFPNLRTLSQNGETLDMGNFFLRHCVNMNKSSEKIIGFCRQLKDCNLHSAPLQFALYCALESKNTELSVDLMAQMKEEGFPLRPHYFWPLLGKLQKDKNSQGTLEVLKAMQNLNINVDVDTYSTYILPTFASVDIARVAIKDVGCAVDTKEFIAAEVRTVAESGDLSALYSLLSSPSFPAIPLSAFRGSLITGFRRSKDVESMAKLTEHLYKDIRFGQADKERAENMAYFLFNMFDGMSETEVQGKEELLREYLTQLKKMNITINVNIYRGIRNVLNYYNTPELIKDVLALVDKQPNEQNVTVSDAAGLSGMEGRFMILESILEEQRSQGLPIGKTLKQLIGALCSEENLSRALEVKAQYEKDMTPSCYALLINLCCRHDNLEEALNLKRELTRMDSEVMLDPSKYINLIRVLTKHGRLDEAEDILKEMKAKNISMTDSTLTMLFHALNSAALKGDVTAVRRLQHSIFTLGLAKPTSNLCSPLVSAHLESGDLPGALDASIACHKQYKQLPRIHDIICKLVEKGDTELLQKAMDFVSQERGEMTMLYDLFFAFLQTGRYKEARKIIETPGLRAKAGRLQWFAEKCIASQQMVPLENMVDMTGKLFECDRDEMYHYMIRLCQDTNDWHKAEAVWTKMQEENVIPRERTLRSIADILRNNDQEVPFDVPEMWYEQSEVEEHPEQTTGESSKVTRPTFSKYGLFEDCNLSVLTLCKRGKHEEAFKVLMDTDRRGIALGPNAYDTLIKALLAMGSLEDAMTVKDIASKHIAGFNLSDMANSLQIVTLVKHGDFKGALTTFRKMLQADRVPSQLSITRLVQSLGSHGDVKSIQEVEDMVKMLGTSINLSHMVFVNNTALAHINNGDVASAVERLESLYTQDTDMPHKSISFVFRKVLEANNTEALDKLSAMAERLCNQFACYRPATDLFLQFVEAGRIEDAKFLLQRCAAVAEQKAVIQAYMQKMSQNPEGASKIKSLLELVPDITEKEKVCTFLIKCYSMDKDLNSAKACYEEMQTEGLHVNELTLKRLALLYKNAGEAVPFVEPPESFKFYADKLRFAQIQSSLDK